MKFRYILLFLSVFMLFAAGCAPKPPSDIVLLKDSVQLKFDKYPRYVGEVRNEGRRNLQLRSVSFTIWKDGKKDYIKDAGIMWTAKYIKPGQAATFEVGFPDLKSKSGLSIYTCEIRWFDRKKNKILSRSQDS